MMKLPKTPLEFPISLISLLIANIINKLIQITKKWSVDIAWMNNIP